MPRTNPVLKKNFNRNSQYLVNEFKTIVADSNIRRIIFFDATNNETTLKDRSTNKKDATLSLTAANLDSSVDGRLRVLNFNASGDFWDFEDSDDLSFGNGTTDSAFSVIVCVNINSLSGVPMLFAKNDNTTGNTNKEYALYWSANNLYFDLSDNSAGSFILRQSLGGYSADVGKYMTYIGTYSGNSGTSGIKMYRNGVQFDASSASGGTYTAMENKSAKAGNYFTANTGAKSGVCSAKYAFVAIVAEELTQSKVTSIDKLLRQYIGVI
jgi:hypothetical protein